MRMGPHLAILYCDWWKRDNKRGGAWMGSFLPQASLLKQEPLIYNVCNFTKPAEGQPALISFDDVTTMFHEFGHALHGMFAKVQYASLSGTAVREILWSFRRSSMSGGRLTRRCLRTMRRTIGRGSRCRRSWRQVEGGGQVQ